MEIYGIKKFTGIKFTKTMIFAVFFLYRIIFCPSQCQHTDT